MASIFGCLPLAARIGLSPLLILTPCGSKCVLVVSTEPLDDVSCWTTPGVGCPGDGLLPVPLTRGGGGASPVVVSRSNIPRPTVTDTLVRRQGSSRGSGRAQHTRGSNDPPMLLR